MTVARSHLSTLLLALATLSLAAPAPILTGSNVLVVDDDGPAPFATIQAAVDAAQDGDVVLVSPGTYPRFRIADKSLVVVGDVGAQVRVDGGIRVVDLAESRLVVLANLTVNGTEGGDVDTSPGLDLVNDAGSVRVEACGLVGAGYLSGIGVRARACADLAIVGCDVRGGRSISGQGTSPSHGLAVTQASRVTVYGSIVRGGDGAPSQCTEWVGDDAGGGGQARDSFLFGGNSTFRGGRGGDIGVGLIFGCPYAGHGGDGIRASNAEVLLFDTVTIGGTGGGGIYPGCGGDCVGTGYTGSDQGGGTFSNLLGDARTLSVQTPALAGTTTTITMRGRPGDHVAVLIAGTTSRAEFVPEWNGMLLVPRPRPGGSTRVLLAGAVPPSGLLSVPLALPSIATGGRAPTFFVQALFRDPLGRRYLSGARSLTVLP